MGCEKDATNFIMTSAPTNLSYYLKLYDNIRMPEFNGNNQTISGILYRKTANRRRSLIYKFYL
ncbi:hypothetical protein PBNK5_28670 [Pectobacterium brasiliense]